MTLHTTLSNLIVLAEEAIVKPQFDRRLLADRLCALAGEVRAADIRPAEDIRTTQAAMVMILCLEEIRDRDEDGAIHWRMLAGTTLPILRGDAFREFRQQRERR